MTTATHTYWLADGTEIGIVSTRKTLGENMANFERILNALEPFGIMPQDQDPPHSKAISFVDTEKG